MRARSLPSLASTRAEKLAFRDKCVARILGLLKAGPKTAAEVSLAVGIHPSTAFAYLYYIERDLRQVRKSGAYNGRGALWELGANPLFGSTHSYNMNSEPTRRTVPATQVGMWRDPLVAWLFGSAPATA